MFCSLTLFFHCCTCYHHRAEKHVNTLYRITHNGTFNAAIQAMSLLFSIAQTKESGLDRFYRALYESLLDPRLITSSKQTMYLNLLFKALKVDANLKRIKAFVKRIVQIASQHMPSFICGLFYILSQIMDIHSGVRTMLTTPEEDDEEEHFKDADSEDEEGAQKTDNNKDVNGYYDGKKREPQFARAERSCLWELIAFKSHYHPSVAKYAQLLFDGVKIDDKPDLHNHTLNHFLDRFVYRTPKKQQTTRGSSIMQPLASRRDGGLVSIRQSVTEAPVNSVEFWRKQVDSVPVDEVFFHKYFTQKRAREQEDPAAKKRRKLEDDVDTFDDSDNEDGQEDEIWKAMMRSVPGGVDEDDEDVEDDDDMDDEMMAALMNSDDEEGDGIDDADDDDLDLDDLVEADPSGASDDDDDEDDE